MASKVIAKLTIKQKTNTINKELDLISSLLSNGILKEHEALTKLIRLKNEIISIANVYTEVLLSDCKLKQKFLKTHSKLYKLYNSCNVINSNSTLKFQY